MAVSHLMDAVENSVAMYQLQYQLLRPKRRYNGVNACPLKKATNMEIVKWQKPTPEPDVDTHILAMWLMYCRAPRKAEPDADGFYDLAEIGADVEKKWTRLPPYSVARREP